MIEEGRQGSRSVWKDVRMIQSVFWASKSLSDDQQGFTSYEYDARTEKADIDYHKHYGLNSHTNEFERSIVFKHMDDRNLASAVPVILSTHTAYHCGLELVTGTFEFVRDCTGQNWLVDARDMYFVP